MSFLFGEVMNFRQDSSLRVVCCLDQPFDRRSDESQDSSLLDIRCLKANVFREVRNFFDRIHHLVSFVAWTSLLIGEVMNLRVHHFVAFVA